MKTEPKILSMLDLGDGSPPIACNGLQEARFFEKVWSG